MHYGAVNVVKIIPTCYMLRVNLISKCTILFAMIVMCAVLNNPHTTSHMLNDMSMRYEIMFLIFKAEGFSP